MTANFARIGSIEGIRDYIQQIEKKYTERIFGLLFRKSKKIQSLFDAPNLVKEVWTEKMGIDPRNELASWSQVGENVIKGILYSSCHGWSPIGLPIGSEIQFETSDAILHIDIKTHREGDADLDRTQDVRPEQISGSTDYKAYFPSILPRNDVFVEDSRKTRRCTTQTTTVL